MRAVGPLQREGEGAVKQAAPREPDLTDHDLPHHRMPEIVDRSALAGTLFEQVASNELLERSHQVGLGNRVAHGTERLVARARSDHGDQLGEFTCRG